MVIAARFGLQSAYASKAMTKPTATRNAANEVPLTGVARSSLKRAQLSASSDEGFSLPWFARR
jgi:hypothetical protein